VLTLICQNGIKPGQKIVIQENKFTIGRKTDNNLPIKSPYVSKHHAEIYLDEKGLYWLKDLNSMNGTIVDDKIVEGSISLNNESQIIFGKDETYKVYLTPKTNGEQLSAEPEPKPEPKQQSAVSEEKSNDTVLNKKPAKPTDITIPAKSILTPNPEQSDSWPNMMDLSMELKGNFKFRDERSENVHEPPIQTGQYDAPRMLWPDVVKLQMELEAYKKAFELAKVFLTAMDEFHIFEHIQKLLPSIIPFKIGIMVLHKDVSKPAEWEKQYLNQKNYELFDGTITIHQRQNAPFKTQLLPSDNCETGMLYHPWVSDDKLLGYIAIVTPLEENGFVKRDLELFQIICQLAEAALAKFWIVF